MGRWAYLATLAGCLLGSGWLEWGMRTRVYRRWLRLSLSVAPVVAVYMVWDAYAISQGHWNFNPRLTTGWLTVASIPVEELAFFIVIPICSVLTFEAVRALRGWKVGDEDAGSGGCQ